MYRRVVLLTSILMLTGAANLFADETFWSVGREEKGSGTLETETRPLDPFTRIHLESGADISITIGPTQSVKVTMDDNLLDNIVTEVRRKTLVISSEGSYTTRKGCRVEITIPSLTRLQISGSGNITVTGLSAPEFEYLLEGSGNLTMDGTVEHLTIEIAGSGDINTERLKAKHVDIEMNGSGDARVFAVESFKGVINGSGNITVIGDPPHTSEEVFGSGEIAHENSH